jgi:hypothetical protein
MLRASEQRHQPIGRHDPISVRALHASLRGKNLTLGVEQI